MYTSAVGLSYWCKGTQSSQEVSLALIPIMNFGTRPVKTEVEVEKKTFKVHLESQNANNNFPRCALLKSHLPR